MSRAYAAIPIFGGVALILGGVAALMLDRADLLANEMEPRPILVRYTSQATFALKRPSHWIFLMACSVFSPCLMVTAQWQGELAESFNQDLQGQLILHATLCALGGFGVALLPMGTVLGTIIHSVAASIFAAFGINYAFRAWALAGEMGNSGLANFRLCMALLGCAGGLITIFSVYPGVSGTSALEVHKTSVRQDPNANGETEGFLTPRSIWWARLAETILASGQISIALTMALTLLSAAAEVGDVQQSPPVAWIVGATSGILMWALVAIFYHTNEKWYAMCQAKEDSDEHDGELERGVTNVNDSADKEKVSNEVAC